MAFQPLDKRFGALDYAPYVLHSGDDRHGESEDGEYMYAEMSISSTFAELFSMR